jgi:hypothetical protein
MFRDWIKQVIINNETFNLLFILLAFYLQKVEI